MIIRNGHAIVSPTVVLTYLIVYKHYFFGTSMPGKLSMSDMYKNHVHIARIQGYKQGCLEDKALYSKEMFIHYGLYDKKICPAGDALYRQEKTTARIDGTE